MPALGDIHQETREAPPMKCQRQKSTIFARSHTRSSRRRGTGPDYLISTERRPAARVPRALPIQPGGERTGPVYNDSTSSLLTLPSLGSLLRRDTSPLLRPFIRAPVLPPFLPFLLPRRFHTHRQRTLVHRQRQPWKQMRYVRRKQSASLPPRQPPVRHTLHHTLRQQPRVGVVRRCRLVAAASRV